MNTIKIDQLDKEISALESAISEIEKRSGTFPKGRLRFHRNNGYVEPVHIFRDEAGILQRTYITDEAQIKRLIDKRYCRQLLSKLKTELAVLETVRSDYRPMEKYECECFVPEKYRYLLNPVVLSIPERCRRWQSEPYERNPYPFPEGEEWNSLRGERVRSRFECIVADRLFSLGQCYKIEAPLFLHGHKKIYPDFTVMHPASGELYYIELFGMMDIPEYAQKAFKRIQEYALFGKTKRCIFIFDHKDAPAGTGVIDSLLKSYFLK